MKNATLRTVIRFVAYYFIGYLIGTWLALSFVSCKAQAQAANERIVLTTTNTVVYRGVVTDESVLSAQMKLMELVIKRGAKTYPIYLVMDSPGGSIDAGLSFIEFAKTIDNLKTISIFSASMASAIVEALPGERLVTQNGTLMFHRAQGQFSGYFEMGEVESRLSAAKAMVLAMETSNASRLRYSLSDYKRLASTELWLFGSDTTRYRAADKTVDVVCSVELIKSSYTISLSGMMGLFNASFNFSGCPLMRSPNSQSEEDFAYVVPSIKNYSVNSVVKVK